MFDVIEWKLQVSFPNWYLSTAVKNWYGVKLMLSEKEINNF